MSDAVDGGLVDWVDRRAIDRSGAVIGVVVDVFGDARTGRPAWLAISTGFFGTRVMVAPIRGAFLIGGAVVVAHPKHVVTTAPMVHPIGAIPLPEERSVIDHYARAGPTKRRPRHR